MAQTYNLDESSPQDNRPVELYDFVFAPGSSGTQRVTSYTHDFVFNGLLYSKRVIKRGSLAVVNSQNNVPEMTITMPVNDPIVQAYIGVGVAPQRTKVTITRFQQASQTSQQIWAGYIASCTVTHRDATFRIASLADDGFRIPIPSVVMSKLCNHVLYDAMCTVSRSGNASITTITSISPDRRTITVASLNSFIGEIESFYYGEFVHFGTTERRTIIPQLVAASPFTVALDVALPTTVFVGDACIIYRGCNHSVATCQTKFQNVDNFGGHPHIQTTNFFYSDLRRTT